MPVVQVQGSSVNFVLVVVYRPESKVTASVVFDEFASVVERLAGCPRRRHKSAYQRSLDAIYNQFLRHSQRSRPRSTRRRSDSSRRSYARRRHHSACHERYGSYRPTSYVGPIAHNIGALPRCLNREIRETYDCFQTAVEGTGRWRLQEKHFDIDVDHWARTMCQRSSTCTIRQWALSWTNTFRLKMSRTAVSSIFSVVNPSL